jgi:hypothetical protein
LDHDQVMELQVKSSVSNARSMLIYPSHRNPQAGLRGSLKNLNVTYIDLYLMHFPFGITRSEKEFDHIEVRLIKYNSMLTSPDLAKDATTRLPRWSRPPNRRVQLLARANGGNSPIAWHSPICPPIRVASVSTAVGICKVAYQEWHPHDSVCSTGKYIAELQEQF